MEIILNNNTLAPQPTSIVNYVGGYQVPSMQTTTINEYSAMTIPTFLRIVSFLTSGLAGFPRDVQKKKGESRIKVKHPLNRILKLKPNNVCSPFALFETWYHHAIVWGNGYMRIARDAKRNVKSLTNLNPELVTPFLYHDDDTKETTKWFFVDAKPSFILSNDEVLHIHGLGFDGLQGYPIVELMRDSLSVGKYAEGHASNYFRNGTVLRGAIEVPGVLTDPQMKTMQASLAQFKGGSTATNDYMILQANAKLNNSTIPNETSQLIETRKFANIDICRMLNAPPHVAYELSDNKYANVEQMSLDVVKYTYKGWIDKSEQEMNLKLLTEKEQESDFYIRFNVDGLLRGDSTSRTTNVTTIVNNGLATPNWGAAVLDLPPLGPDGDKIRIPVAVSQPLNPSAEPKAKEAAPDAPGSTVSDEPQKNAAKSDAATYAAVIDPLIADACARVEAKTAKAFERRDGKDAAALIPWANVFAEQQAKYATLAFEPIAAAAEQLGGKLDAVLIGSRYATEVKRLASTQQKRDLSEIVKEVVDGN